MPAHAFVDETKANGLVMALTVIDSRDVARARQALRQLLLPKQRRIHFQKERDARRAQVLATMADLPLSVRLYTAPGRPAAVARRDALSAIAADLDTLGVERLVIETDEVFVRRDMDVVNRMTARLQRETPFAFHHLPASAEPLLWASDAVAWCFARGGQWAKDADPLIEQVIHT